MSSTTKDYTRKIIPWDSTYQRGIGIEYMTRQSCLSPLENFEVLDFKPGGGQPSQKVKSVLRRIESKEELVEMISAQLSGTGSVMSPKGGGGGSFFSQFVNENKIYSYNLYFSLFVQVVNGTQYIDDQTVKASIQRELPADFSKKYGDHLIEGVRTGGLYLALIEIVTNTEEKKQEVLNKLGLNVASPSLPSPGNVKSAVKTDEESAESDDIANEAEDSESGTGEAVDKTGAKAASDLSVMLKKAQSISNTETRIRVERIGGTGPLNFSDPQQMTEQAEAFPSSALSNGDIIYAVIKPYTLLENLPETTSETYLSSQVQYYRNQLQKRGLRAQSILENIDYTLNPNHRALFKESEQELRDNHDRISAYIATINQLVAELEADPREFISNPSKLDSIPKQLDLSSIPQRIVTTGKVLVSPSKIPNPRTNANLVCQLMKEALFHETPKDVTEQIEIIGSFLADFYSEMATAANAVVWGFSNYSSQRLQISLNRIQKLTSELRESLISEVPELIGPLAKHLSRNTAEVNPHLNNVNMLLDFLRQDENSNNGLWEYLEPIEEFLKNMEVIKDKLTADNIQCNNEEWTLMADRFLVAERILGKQVRLGRHKKILAA